MDIGAPSGRVTGGRCIVVFTLYLLLSSFQFAQVIVPYLGIPPDKYFLVDGRWREAPSFLQFYLQPHNNISLPVS
jgi:hypothetical protein